MPHDQKKLQEDALDPSSQEGIETPSQLEQELASSSYEDGAQRVRPEATKKKSSGFFSKLKSSAKSLWKSTKETGKEAASLLKSLNPLDALHDAMLSDPDRLTEVLAATADIPNQDIIYEQLAHAGAYGSLDPGHTLQWGYREAGSQEDGRTGFRAVLYTPTDDVLEGTSPTAKAIQQLHGRPLKPVVAFRGTANKRGVIDDTNTHGVGAFQFTANEAAIHSIMEAAGGKADVTGHSLGGALAQLTACRLPSLVGRVVTFQAPAVSDEDNERLNAHNANASDEDKIASTHFRAHGDLVHLAGDQLTEGDVYTMDYVGMGNVMDHMSFPLAHLNAARGHAVGGIRDVGDRIVRVEKNTAQGERSAFGDFSEKVRRGAGKLYDAVANTNVDDYAVLWEDIREMITRGHYPLNMILGIIDDTDKMKDKDKSRMKANAVTLYEKLGGGQNN